MLTDLARPTCLVSVTDKLVGMESPFGNRRRAHEAHVQALEDLSIALLGLGHLTERDETAAHICRITTRLAHGTGSMLFVVGPGRVDAIARHGIHPVPPDPELGIDPNVELVLRGGRPLLGDPLLVPLIGTTGVVGVVSVAAPQQAVDDFDAALLVLFGTAVGPMLERFSAPVEPGDRQQASSAIAALRTGDAVLVISVDGDAPIAERLGLHLRETVRPGDAVAELDDAYLVVLRGVRGTPDAVLARITTLWDAEHPGHPLTSGIAVHSPERAPLDTVEAARSR